MPSWSTIIRNHLNSFTNRLFVTVFPILLTVDGFTDVAKDLTPDEFQVAHPVFVAKSKANKCLSLSSRSAVAVGF